MTRMTAFTDRTPRKGEFDADWYRATYPDVAMLRMDPEEHFRLYGALMGRAPNAGLAGDPARISLPGRTAADTDDAAERAAALKLPAPRKGGELLAAHEIALTGSHARAIHYARHHLPPELAHTIQVLEANRAIVEGDEAGWLGHLNGYLGHFGVAPVVLAPGGDENILSRITTGALLPTTDGPLVTVIMPAWNARKTISYAVQSILNQTWRNLELLIVDDASEDDTWNIIQRLAGSDKRIRTFRNSVNVGPYVSKNVAVTQAKGEWITGHDTDDWAHPERIARQVEFCVTNKTPVCMSGMLRISEAGQFVRLNPVAGFAYDGASRSAFISLIVVGQYFHDILGAWDSVRVSGDSEILRRIKRISGAEVPKMPAVTMFCLDSPDGLTNHPTLGHAGETGISKHRLKYRENLTKFHNTIDQFSGRLHFRTGKREFPAPPHISVPTTDIQRVINGHKKHGTNIAFDGCADVVILTNLRFPGGNASSTLDEFHHLKGRGLSVKLIHAPVDVNLGRPRSDRFRDIAEDTLNWTEVQNISAKVVIARQPWALTSHAFRQIAHKITAEHAFIVVNNSYLRESGGIVYDRGDLIKSVRKINTDNLTFCPISPVIRKELQDHAQRSGEKINFSETDWSPTFDLAQYRLSPQKKISLPFRIGRHGRDGADKWLEKPHGLKSAYPSHNDFRVIILGGAKQARKILKSMPSNWTVFNFGEIKPRDYLNKLDAFVFFPHSKRIEAFGRTIVEAMLAARPVILPRVFETTFDNLPIYCSAEQVERVVRELAQDDAGRIAYLTEVQAIAAARYASPVIARRLAGTGLDLPQPALEHPRLSDTAMRFKRRIETTAP